MGEEFFVIKCDADGTTFDGPMTRTVLEERLSEHYYGGDVEFASKNPGIDGFCFKLKENELLILRATIVQPPLRLG